MFPQDQRIPAWLTQQPTTIFTGQAPQRLQMLDMQNIPGMGGSTGMILSMLLQPLIMQLTHNMGYAGLQFGGVQNFYDRFQAHDFFLESRKAIQDASRRDERQYMQTLLGVSRLTGTVIGPKQITAAQTMAGDIAKMGTILGDIMPDVFDAMHGTRGSAAVLARRVHLSSRYSFDPITGEIGMRGETAGQLSSEIFDQLFGPRADLRQMRGFGAGRMGQLFDEMNRRGIISTATTSREDAFMKALADKPNMTIKDVAASLAKSGRIATINFDTFKELENNAPGSGVERIMNAPEVRADIIKNQATQISGKLKNLVGAVSAMRDIFGDMGKHDAPMVELINGLQALTQGGLSTMSPGQLEMTVRRMQQLTKMSGITLEGMTQLLNRGANLADQFGLDRRFAVQATQSSAAFAAAVNQTGILNTPGYKQPDKDTLMSMDQSLRLAAARSDVANQFNATLRIANEMGVKENTNFGRLAEAIRTNQKVFRFEGPDGRKTDRSIVVPFAEWRRLAQEAGIRQDTAFIIRSQAIANQEYGLQFNTGDLVRSFQREVDINPVLNISGQVAFGNLTRNDNTKTLALSQAATDALWNMKSRTRNDPTARYAAMSKAVSERAKTLGLNIPDNQLQQAVVTMWTTFENRVGEMEQLRGYGSALGVFAAHDPQTDMITRQNNAVIDDRARLSRALSGLGRVGVMRRFMDTLAASDGTITVQQIIGDVLAGGVKKADFAAAMSDFAKEQGKLNRPGITEDARRNILQEMDRLAKRAGLGTIQNTEFAQALQQLGEAQQQYTAIPAVGPGADPAKKAKILEEINKLTQKVKEQAELAGQSTTSAGVKDVDDVLLVAKNLTTFTTPVDDNRDLSKPPDQRRKVTQDDAARRTAAQFEQAAQGLRWNLLLDPERERLIRQKGLLPLLSASRDRWQEIQTLSFKTGIPVADLLANTGKAKDLDADTKARIKELKTQETEGIQKIRDAVSEAPGTVPAWNELAQLAKSKGLTVEEFIGAKGAFDKQTQQKIEALTSGKDITPGNRAELGKLSKELNIPIADLIAGTGAAVKLDAPTRNRIADLLGKPASEDDVKALAAAREKEAQLMVASSSAETLIHALGADSTIQPSTKKLLISQLESAAARAGIAGALASFQKVRTGARGLTVDGKKLESDQDVLDALKNEKKRKDLYDLNPELRKDIDAIDKIIQALRGTIGIDQIVPASSSGPDATVDKFGQTVSKVSLDGPLEITGSVRVVGDQIQFVDSRSKTHPNPVEANA